MVIIGAGIVGAATAWWASRAQDSGSPTRRILLLEAEAAPGMHSTGRSAALYAPGYGPPMVRALTWASRAFYRQPPEGFAAQPLLSPRGALFVGSAARRAALAELMQTLQAEGGRPRWLEAAELQALVPVLEPAEAAFGVLDEQSLDIDVDALLQGFLRGARAAGVQLCCAARLAAVQRQADGWTLTAADGRCWRARQIVNAAGAWADEIAALAGVPRIGLQPRRRTAFVFEPPPGLAIKHWPAVIDIDEQWYFKPEAGLLLGSPANADPVPPHDVMPEELDVAIGIDHLQRVSRLRIHRPRRTWAGLRSFVPDGEPVIGPQPGAPGFFWAAALGGYGIQTAPAVGALAAAWLDAARTGQEPQVEGRSARALWPRVALG
ncbi:MAG: FAD-binding oxidoreductase [Rubrivivax sp.]|nr:FAD-binding oxidoreductase [Rubrivivax sp.]